MLKGDERGGQVTHMKWMKNEYKVLIKYYEGKKTHIKPRSIREIYIKMDLKEIS
jgi:hypothetical protein